MRIFNVTFLAVLSSIAMIGATSIEDPSPAYEYPLCTIEEIEMYVTLQQLMEVLT